MILFSGGLVIFILLLMSYFVDKAIAQSGGYPAQADAFYYLMLFVFFEMGFSFSWGPVTYVYCAEVFDIGTRAAGVGLTSSVEAISSTMIRMYFITYATVLPEFYQHMTFLSVAAISFLFVYYLLPETSNKTSNEIGKAYQKHRPAILRLDWGPN